MMAAVAVVAATAIGCDDDDDGMQRPPPPVTPPVEPLASVGLELLAEGFTSPVLLMEAPDDSGRLFVGDQVGVIRIIDANGQMLDTPFIDLRDRLVDLMEDFDERGLLGLAFHPDYANNGRLFVYYSAPLREGGPEGWDHTSHISEFVVSGADVNRVDMDSELIVLQVDQPQFNHNGGTLAFGPDGFLYISLGDGGMAHDVGLGHPPLGNGQDITTLLGSILRIDVDGDRPYAIPQDNPFVGMAEGRDEIYAYGFRNPFRISFDTEDGRLFVGDAGQHRWEEIDIVELGGNYGWNIREGTHCFDPQAPRDEPASCSNVGPRGEPLQPPILEYPNADAVGGIGTVVIGGHVYRGERIPELEGEYIFGDFSADAEQPLGLVFAARETDGGEWEMRTLEIANGPLGEFVRGFGRDRSGELYLLTAGPSGPAGTAGRVYRMLAAEDVPPPMQGLTEQLERGMTLYAANCARCHGETGQGTVLAPPLVGEGALPLDPPPERQLRDTQFRTALDVFEFISEFMPFDMPGTLSTQTYLDILAFALRANEVPLTAEVTEQGLEAIVINPPAP